MTVRPGVLVVPALLAALLRGGPVPAVELDGGAALRGNMLWLHSPPMGMMFFNMDRTRGITETALRGRVRARARGMTVDAAIDSRGTMASSSSGLGGDGVFFAVGKPLERWDATRDHARTDTARLRTRLDALSVSFDAGPVDIIAGRQPVSFGTSRFVSVLDVVAPFAPGDLDATYKPGVDALRIRTGLGRAGEFEVVGVGARPWGGGALVGVGRSSFRGVDAIMMGGRFRHRGFGGLAWDGDMGSFGLWGEIAAFERRPAVEKWRGGWSKAAFSGVAGVDFYLPWRVRTGMGVMYQDFGARHPGDLVSVYADAPYREGWAFLGSAGYGLVTLHRQIHPLVNADAAGLVNAVDGSTLWQPRVTVSVSDNADLAFYGWIGTGRKPNIENVMLAPRSEFGMFPDGGGVYARWFF